METWKDDGFAKNTVYDVLTTVTKEKQQKTEKQTLQQQSYAIDSRQAFGVLLQARHQTERPRAWSLLCAPADTGTNDARQLLLADAEQQANGKADGANNRHRETRNQPERHADVLLLAHVAAPLGRAETARAVLGLVQRLEAVAHKAAALLALACCSATALAVVNGKLVDTLAVFAAVVGLGDTGIEGLEAARDAGGRVGGGDKGVGRNDVDLRLALLLNAKLLNHRLRVGLADAELRAGGTGLGRQDAGVGRLQALVGGPLLPLGVAAGLGEQKEGDVGGAGLGKGDNLGKGGHEGVDSLGVLEEGVLVDEKGDVNSKNLVWAADAPSSRHRDRQRRRWPRSQGHRPPQHRQPTSSYGPQCPRQPARQQTCGC